MRDTRLKPYQVRKWRAHFGARPEVCLSTYRKLVKSNPDLSLRYFFMALYFLKTYGTEETIATRFRVDPQTVRTWVWRIIFWIADLAPSLVSTSNM